MPIYEYQCTSCHQHFDLMQKMSEPPRTKCPNCAKDSLSKLVSAAGFQLKGTGWYATDFKNKGSAPAPTNDKASTPAATETTSTPAAATKSKDDAS